MEWRARRLLFALACSVVLRLFIADAHAQDFTTHEGARLLLKAIGGDDPRAYYQWDLDGDGTFETRARRPSVTFDDNGDYQVNYQTLDGEGSAPRTVSIAVYNSRPAARIPVSYYRGTVGQTIQLSAAVRDASRADTAAGFSFTWDFGDGTPVLQGTKLNLVSHAFTAAGTYRIRVRVLDKDGGESGLAKSTAVIKPAAASGSPTARPTSTPRPPPAATPVPAAALPTPFADAAGFVTVNPPVIAGYVPNADAGWQSCDRVNSSGHDAQSIPNTLAYIKYYWKDLEPGDGRFDFSVFDSNLAKAAASGQKVAFRVVNQDNTASGPAWLKQLGAHGYGYSYVEGGSASPTQWAPDMNDPLVQSKHFALLSEMGRRYNKNPLIDSIDIGTVGLWGEWHFGQTSPAVPMPTLATARSIIDRYFAAFPDVPKIAQLEEINALKYALSKGAGFRGDCWGNMDYQMTSKYPNTIAAAAAQDTWKTAPIYMETCWDIQTWVNKGWDVGFIFDWALAHHVSAVNNKNRAVPAALSGKLASFLSRLGYRYLLRSVRYPASASAGTSLPLEMQWENAGVAPSYGGDVLGLRLKRADGSAAATITTTNLVRDWLPGVFEIDAQLPLPAALSPGIYVLAVAAVDPSTALPTLRLSNAVRDDSGWYPIGTVRIAN